MKKLLLLSGITALAVACATNPLTGRKSLQLVSNATILPSSFQQYQEVLASSKVITETEQAKEVQTAGQKIAAAAATYYQAIGKSSVLNGYEWQFSLIDSKTVNAWCLPGGKVAVYSGIMPVCENANGLAVVLGHEISHALAGHGAEKISRTYAAEKGGQLLGMINNAALQQAIQQYYPSVSNITLLRYDRKQESDADITGLYLMAMAGYDPREAPKFWGRMIGVSGKRSTPEFLSTHPDPQNRIAALNAALPKALEYYNASKDRTGAPAAIPSTTGSTITTTNNATKSAKKQKSSKTKSYVY
ncbi:MAG: M48 family metallopeptidase [Flavobacteriaceae bacterium]|jgi:predicted Zn-dependent protease|nr:M48 family metallopeptidase [Flavobacteriaceae bacterium]